MLVLSENVMRLDAVWHDADRRPEQSGRRTMFSRYRIVESAGSARILSMDAEK